MTSLAEGMKIGDFVLMEGENNYSRDVATLSASQTISIGEVLEPDSSNVKAGAVAANLTAIALEAKTTGAGETAKILVLRRHAIVAYGRLTVNSLTEADVKARLLALGIVSRDDAAVLQTQST